MASLAQTITDNFLILLMYDFMSTFFQVSGEQKNMPFKLPQLAKVKRREISLFLEVKDLSVFNYGDLNFQCKICRGSFSTVPLANRNQN